MLLLSSWSLALTLWVGIIASGAYVLAFPYPFSAFDGRPQARLASCMENSTIRNHLIDMTTSTVDLDSPTRELNGSRCGASDRPANISTPLPHQVTLVSSQTPDESGNNSKIPDTDIAIIPFLLVAALVIACYLFGPSAYRRLFRNPNKLHHAGPGFGFDGLTKAQLKAVRLKEEWHGIDGAWFVRLPDKPPALVLKQVPPLTPIQLKTGYDDSDSRQWSGGVKVSASPDTAGAERLRLL
jgi:hypothetical protein